MNIVAILVGAVAVYVVSGVWYAAWSKERRRLLGRDPSIPSTRRQPAWKTLAELGRNIVFAAILSRLVALIGVADATGAATLAVALWIAFPAMILAGASLWDDVPWKLSAIHSGDWLLKLLVLCVLLGLWR